MKISRVEFDFRPNSSIKKIVLSTLVISLIAIGIILAAAYLFQLNPLFACISGGTGLISFAVYAIDSCKKKKAETFNFPKPLPDETNQSSSNSISIEQPLIFQKIELNKNDQGSFENAILQTETTEIIPTDVSINIDPTLDTTIIVIKEPPQEIIVDSREEFNMDIPPSNSNCGNKYQGIIELNEILTMHPTEGVMIPLPMGLSHEQVDCFLKHIAPEIFNEWASLCELFKAYMEKNNKESAANFLEEAEVKKCLKKIRVTIKNCFTRAAKAKGVRPFEIYLREWIHDIKVKNSYLMVRSSSVEDSKDLANAGGNLSEKYILPELEDVLIACGRVIASYFREASLKNRLEALTDPFSSPLMLSVILHELIGESIDFPIQNQIPISIVLFSTEPDYSEEGFSVTKISCTYGHGEGVVNNEKIATDTIYVVPSKVDSSGYVEIYKNRAKPNRLAPIKKNNGKIDLQIVKNPQACISERSLSKKMVIRLVELGKKVEFHKKTCMDMEIVIKGDTIYVVQAREVVRSKAEPTYLSEMEIEKLKVIENPVLETKYAQVLVPGRGSVEIINTSNEILYAPCLKDAESAFKKGIHKLVIVSREEPDNSHPVVNFSGKGIICLFNPNQTEIQTLIQKISSSQCLVVCPQSGRMSLWNNKYSQDSCILQGYFTHPADMKISLDPTSKKTVVISAGNFSKVPDEISQLIRSLKEATVAQAALKSLEELKNVSCVSSLKGRIKIVENQIAVSGFSSGQASEVLEILKKIELRVDATFKEIEHSFINESPRLEKLFHIKTLSTLLSSTTVNAEFAFSILHVNPLVQIAEKALDYQKKLPFESQFDSLLWIGENSVNFEGEKVWESFLLNLEEQFHTGNTSKSTINDFQMVLEKLKDLNMLPLWFNLFFLPTLSTDDSNSACQKIAECKIDFDKDHFQKMEKRKEEMLQLKEGILNFSNSQKFAASWKILKEIGEYFSSPEYVDGVIKSSSLSKAIYTQMMREYTELFDFAVKTMKASLQFSDREKIKQMDEMLKLNFTVLKVWIYDLIQEKNLDLERDWQLDKYFNNIEHIWRSCRFNSHSLNPSENFSVQGACLSSRTNYDRHFPETLEDIFTLIHQNQLFALSTITKFFSPNPLNLVSFPEIMKAGIQSILKMNHSLSFFGMDLFSQEIHLHFNIPLRNHSAVIHLSYNRSNNNVIIKVELFGEARERWLTISKWVQMMDYASLLKLKESPSVADKEIVFSWIIQDIKEFSSAKIELSEMIDYTMEKCQGDILNAIRLRVKQKNKATAIKMGEWFFNHLDEGWKGINLLADYLTSTDGIEALRQLSLHSETKDLAKKQLNTLKHLIDCRFGIKKKIFSQIISTALIAVKNYIDKELYLSKCVQLLRNLIDNPEALAIAEELLIKVNKSDDLKAIKLTVKIYNLFILAKWIYKIESKLLVEAEKYAINLMKKEDKESLSMACTLFSNLIDINIISNSALECAQKLKPFNKYDAQSLEDLVLRQKTK